MKSINLSFEVNVATLLKIIHEDRMMHKICAKFVPWVLSDVQKERRIGN